MTQAYNPGTPAGRFESVLLELLAEGATQQAQLELAQELADFGEVISRFPPADEKVLHSLFKGGPEVGDLTGDRRVFVHLPHLRVKAQVLFPVLTFAYNWPREVLRLRVALFYRVVEQDKSELRAFGMRFETPECWDSDDDAVEYDPERVAGHHDMFHAQPLSELRLGDATTELPGLRWVNATQPSIPVSATDLSGLVVAMLVAVYGRKRVRQRYQAQKLQALKEAAIQVSGLQHPPRKAAA